MKQRILVGLDKFKNAIGAGDACRIVTEAALSAGGFEVDSCPLTDGGEGFGMILTASAGGNWRKVSVRGARGVLLDTGYGIVDGSNLTAAARELIESSLPAGHRSPLERVAVVELASASGLAQLSASDRDPWKADTFGTGELMRIAASEGVSVILLGVGGSATNDLGLGALSALGARLRVEDGAQSMAAPENWSMLSAIELVDLVNLPPLLIACDVSNPLLGERGCTAVYGPQKGLSSTDFEPMERLVERVSSLLCRAARKPLSLRDAPGGGAAGGIAFGMKCALGATLVSGNELVGKWLSLGSRLEQADVLVTGEGRFDGSSLEGKGPGALAIEFVASGKPTYVLCGAAEEGMAIPEGLRVRPITPRGMPLTEALQQTPCHLRQAATSLFDELSVGQKK